ncbi:hypothetical protein OKW21_000654 [Catalinimonas alkaloidigena]|uniref:hypothetical protein n=1 Tax=Catalinimonas alkaloidigena TaxID=1075417 RepID=UPI0024073776|nr:hypothetical protein [Catalinimonas alkaloidigena]MDF9795391.1 hypothetical protein [Catalinimonas alkaloidigena]
MNYKGKIALILFLIIIYVFVHSFVLNQVFITESDLKEVSGTVYSQQLERVPGKGNNKSIVLSIVNEPLRFSVHEKYERAFSFLKTNRVLGKSISIMYDPNGFNGFSNNRTAHIFNIQIDDHEILNIKEATALEKNVLIILMLLDLVIFTVIFLKRKSILKQNTTI